MDWYAHFALACSFYLIAICGFGFIANTASTVVFYHRTFRDRSINVLLTALSATDALLMLVSGPTFACGPLVTYFNESVILDTLYNYSLVYVYPLASICQMASVWLHVLITFERWMAVSKPFLVSSYCTRKKAFAAAACVLLAAVSINVVRWWEFKLDKKGEALFELRNNTGYVSALTATQMVLLYSAPFVSISAFTLNMTLNLKRAAAQRNDLTRVPGQERRTCVMLRFIALAFLLFHLPSFVLALVEYVDPFWFQSSYAAYAISDVSNIMAIMNSASTAFIYFNYSSKYRRTLLHLVCKGPYPTPDAASRSRMLNNTRLLVASNPNLLSLGHPSRQGTRMRRRSISSYAIMVSAAPTQVVVDMTSTKITKSSDIICQIYHI